MSKVTICRKCKNCCRQLPDEPPLEPVDWRCLVTIATDYVTGQTRYVQCAAINQGDCKKFEAKDE